MISENLEIAKLIIGSTGFLGIGIGIIVIIIKGARFIQKIETHIQNFDKFEKKVDQRFDKVDEEFNKIEKDISDVKERIAYMEADVIMGQILPEGPQKKAYAQTRKVINRRGKRQPKLIIKDKE